jgi:hypothetical protein
MTGKLADKELGACLRPVLEQAPSHVAALPAKITSLPRNVTIIAGLLLFGHVNGGSRRRVWSRFGIGRAWIHGLFDFADQRTPAEGSSVS